LSYRILVIIFLRVHIQTRCTARGHSLVTILSGKKAVLARTIVNTLDDLGPHQGAFGDDAFKGDHAVQVLGAQCSRVAREFSEGSDIRAVVALQKQVSSPFEWSAHESKPTTSSDVSLAGRFGIVPITFFKARSKACE
jgi:hypothetical protein